MGTHRYHRHNNHHHHHHTELDSVDSPNPDSDVTRTASVGMDDLPQTMTPIPDAHTKTETDPATEDDSEDVAKKKGCCCVVWTKIGHAIYNELVPVGINMKMFLPLLMILLCEGICSLSISSYMGYMIVDIGAASTTDSVGTWAGWLNASFSICQFFSSFLFGWLSDRIGRRTILLIGTFGTLVTTVGFGFAPNIIWAIALRSLNGLLNGNVGIVKACIAEMTTPQNRVKAFSYVGLMYGVGSIIGSSIGGAAARPAIAHPDEFESSGFFGIYPYALTNFIIGAIVLFTFITTLLFVKETGSGGTWCRKCKKAKAANTLDDDPKGADRSAVLATTPSLPHEPTLEELASVGVVAIPEDDEYGGGFVIDMYPDKPIQEDMKNTPFSIKDPILAILSYTISSAFQNIAYMMISTWTIASVANGGLNFTPSNVGTLTAISGVAMTISLIFFVPRIVAKLGLVTSIRTAIAFLIPIMVITPFSNEVALLEVRWGVWLYIILCVFLWQSFAQLMMNCSIVLISNSVPSKKLAMVNGAGQAFGAGARALCPIGIGPLIEWCLSNGKGYPFNQLFPFLVNVFLLLIYLVTTFFLPPGINYPFAVSHPNYVEPPPKSKDKKDSD